MKGARVRLFLCVLCIVLLGMVLFSVVTCAMLGEAGVETVARSWERGTGPLAPVGPLVAATMRDVVGWGVRGEWRRQCINWSRVNAALEDLAPPMIAKCILISESVIDGLAAVCHPGGLDGRRTILKWRMAATATEDCVGDMLILVSPERSHYIIGAANRLVSSCNSAALTLIGNVWLGVHAKAAAADTGMVTAIFFAFLAGVAASAARDWKSLN